jgi:hypothetical protein
LGDLLVGHNGVRTAVESVTITDRHDTVYNLRVAEDRTYFVGGGDWDFSVWVHNTYSVQTVNGVIQVVDDTTGAIVRSGFATPEAAATEAAQYNAILAKAIGGKVGEAAEVTVGAATATGHWIDESTAGWSARAKAYQQQITGRPAGTAFRVTNGGASFNFDGYDATGFIEAKGPGYADNLARNWFDNEWLSAAKRQVAAANGVPITWAVAEKPVADYISALFADQFPSIKVVFTPFTP